MKDKLQTGRIFAKQITDKGLLCGLHKSHGNSVIRKQRTQVLCFWFWFCFHGKIGTNISLKKIRGGQINAGEDARCHQPSEKCQ